MWTLAFLIENECKKNKTKQNKQKLSLGFFLFKKRCQKTREAELHDFLQTEGLKAWNFKNQQAPLWDSPEVFRKLSLHT